MGKKRNIQFFFHILFLPAMTWKNCQIKRTLQSYPRQNRILKHHFVEKHPLKKKKNVAILTQVAPDNQNHNDQKKGWRIIR